MARRGDGTTTLITIGNPTSLTDLGGAPGSKAVLAWFFPAGWGETNGGRIFDKANGAFTAGWLFNVATGDGVNSALTSFGLTLGGATTGRAFGVNDTLSLNKWWCGAGSYTPGDGGPRLYLGDQRMPMAEVTYSTMTNSTRRDVVTYGTDAAEPAYLFNRAAADRTFDGPIALVVVFDNLLTLAQCERIRRFPFTHGSLFPRRELRSFRTAAGAMINVGGCWLLDETGMAVDISPNANHGALTATDTRRNGPFRLPVRYQPLRTSELAAFAAGRLVNRGSVLVNGGLVS